MLSVDPELESSAMRRLRLAAVTVIYAGKITFVSGIVKVILKLSLSVPHYTWCGKRSLFCAIFLLRQR